MILWCIKYKERKSIEEFLSELNVVTLFQPYRVQYYLCSPMFIFSMSYVLYVDHYVLLEVRKA